MERRSTTVDAQEPCGCASLKQPPKSPAHLLPFIPPVRFSSFSTTIHPAMKHALHAILTAAFLLPATLSANTAPTVVIQSATMRPGTTLMDVVYRVNDPDDATVKTRALAFVDGVRSFANVLRPVTFVEGTAAKLGDAIPANTNHTLTWDVGADWNIDLGQIQFEVLAMDGRGLLPFDWVTIPAAGGNPALTVSKNTPTDQEVLDAFYWKYASNDSEIVLENGIVKGAVNNGVFSGINMIVGNEPETYAAPFIFKTIGYDPADTLDLKHAGDISRSGISNVGWNAARRPYTGISLVAASGDYGTIPAGLNGLNSISSSPSHSNIIAIKKDGSLGWSDYSPFKVTDALRIAQGSSHTILLRSNGTLLGWGSNENGQTDIPTNLNNITAIAAGYNFSAALKSNGTVVAWGYNEWGQTNVPTGLSNVISIAAGQYHCVALKSDGKVVQWGMFAGTPPSNLSGVTKIASGHRHVLALKGDGTVVAWGSYDNGQPTPPIGLSGVVDIAGGFNHSVALKSNGLIVIWGTYNKNNVSIKPDVPATSAKITGISAGRNHTILLQEKTY
jgi:hypothetical protein